LTGNPFGELQYDDPQFDRFWAEAQDLDMTICIHLGARMARWRKHLAERASVRNAVRADYPALLRDFIDRRNSWLSSLQARAAA